jgi:wyosine [tRNA(Phe)-imidazoG37] synthetase (radical SAM superfamily)
MKLDAVDDFLINIIDQPGSRNFTAQKIIEQLTGVFRGRLIIQTIFFRGEYKGTCFDNSTDEHVEKWINALKIITPYKVMIYTISRDTPVKSLGKLTPGELEAIALKVREEGFEVSVSA